MDGQQADLGAGERERVDPGELVADEALPPGVGAVVEPLGGREHPVELGQRRGKLLGGEEAGEAAAALGCSQAKINYLEVGKTQQKPDQVTILLRRYGADAEHIDRMASLAARADQGTWWAPFGDVLPNWFRTFVGLEGLAAAEFT